MKISIDETVFRAYEERHSRSSNLNERWAGKIPYRDRHATPQLERATDFRCIDPVLNNEPTDALLLALLTKLARHLIRSRTNPYRVRRDRAQSAKADDRFYVPLIDYELHWSSLSVWHRRHKHWPAICRQGNALHPATSALIEMKVSAAQWQSRPIAHSLEEFDHLGDEQLMCNGIAERMRAWISQPANSVKVKAWETRLDKDKLDFNGRCSRNLEDTPQQMLRFDLFYAGQIGPDRGFGAIPSAAVKNDVDRLRETLESCTHFDGQVIELHPYADFSVIWVIPGLILLPVSAGSPWTLLKDIENCWRHVAGPRYGGLQADYTKTNEQFRYVSEEQRMFDPLWLQISHAASYFFDTRVILDSSLEAITSPERFSPPNFNSKQLHRGELCAP